MQLAPGSGLCHATHELPPPHPPLRARFGPRAATTRRGWSRSSAGVKAPDRAAGRDVGRCHSIELLWRGGLFLLHRKFGVVGRSSARYRPLGRRSAGQTTPGYGPPGGDCWLDRRSRRRKHSRALWSVRSLRVSPPSLAGTLGRLGC